MARVAIIMGSVSDWAPAVEHCSKTLDTLGVDHDVKVISAHRAPDALVEYVRAQTAAGTKLFIAAAGGAAHLPGVVAGLTHRPVVGVPIKAWSLEGLDSLLSIAQMPGGVPVATMSIGKPGAVNAAVFAAEVLAIEDAEVESKLKDYRAAQTKKVLDTPDPREG